LGAGVSPTHTYGAADTYTVSLEVTNDGGLTDTARISTAPNNAPMATGDAYSTDEDTPLNVPAPGVLGNDPPVADAVRRQRFE
jgi:hypothetical protein